MSDCSFMMRKHGKRLDLDTLIILLALVEERSVTRAAERLDMTQSGVSHALRRLRDSFSDPLLVRTSKGMQPTPRALELSERISRIVAEVGALTGDAAHFDPGEAQRMFTICADDNMSLHLIPSLLERLSQRAPGIDLRVVAPPDQPRQALEQGRIDLLLGLLEPDQPGLYTNLLFNDSFVVIARKGHPTLSRRPTLKQFAAAGHVLVSTRLPARSVVDELLAQHGLRRRVVLRIAHFLAAVRVVAKSDLVLTAPRRLVRDSVAQASLQMLQTPLDLPSVAIHQTWHERMHSDPAHQWMRGLLTEISASTRARPQRREPGKKAKKARQKPSKAS